MSNRFDKLEREHQKLTEANATKTALLIAIFVCLVAIAAGLWLKSEVVTSRPAGSTQQFSIAGRATRRRNPSAQSFDHERRRPSLPQQIRLDHHHVSSDRAIRLAAHAGLRQLLVVRCQETGPLLGPPRASQRTTRPRSDHRAASVHQCLPSSRSVSQFLIAEVQRSVAAPTQALDQAFRTLLFKIFNRIDTWEVLEEAIGPVCWEGFDFGRASLALETRRRQGFPIYSAAYIMPSPRLGLQRKHENHLALLHTLFSGRGAEILLSCKTLSDAYHFFLGLPGIGQFLAFQFSIDLGYSKSFAYDEAAFVVAGPGARDGIAKCFSNWREFALEDIIMAVHAVQDLEFKQRALGFRPIGNRALQPIDCQNFFCEVSKYSRIAHPDVRGADGRRRIKQKYSPSTQPLPSPVFPEHWHVSPTAAV